MLGSQLTPLHPCSESLGQQIEWTFDGEQLEDVVTGLWLAEGASVSLVASLPTVPNSGRWLPYRAQLQLPFPSSGAAAAAAAAAISAPVASQHFICTAAAAALIDASAEADAKLVAHCHVCHCSGPRAQAVSHISAHVAREGGDVSTFGGSSFCFFCGSSSGCVTSLVKKGKSMVVQSNRPYTPSTFKVVVAASPARTTPAQTSLSCAPTALAPFGSMPWHITTTSLTLRVRCLRDTT